jgi:hypothetical protein
MTLFSDAKLPPTPLEVLISQMAQYRDINSVLGKALGVLGHAKFFEPVCNLLYCGAPSERTLRCACEHISLRRELGHPVPQRRCRPHGGVGWSCALGGRGRPACCGPGNGPHCPWRGRGSALRITPASADHPQQFTFGPVDFHDHRTRICPLGLLSPHTSQFRFRDQRTYSG